MTNLSNYVNLSKNDVDTNDLITAIKVKKTGLGSGMLGLPGDFTPPSRFIRSAFFSAATPKAETSEQGVMALFHILNNFDIPKGAVVEEYQGKKFIDFTQWTSVNDMSNKRFYFHTHADSSIKMVDLTKVDLNAKEVVTISMDGKTPVVDMSAKQ